jgi:hypothetical protein
MVGNPKMLGEKHRLSRTGTTTRRRTIPAKTPGPSSLYCIQRAEPPQHIGLIHGNLRSTLGSSLPMDTKRLPTRWLYIMDYVDEETGTAAATMGSADDRDECEGVVLHETNFYERQGFTIVRGEACELCRGCEGDGLIGSAGSERRCPQCGGFTGAFRRLRFKTSGVRS